MTTTSDTPDTIDVPAANVVRTASTSTAPTAATKAAHQPTPTLNGCARSRWNSCPSEHHPQR